MILDNDHNILLLPNKRPFKLPSVNNPEENTSDIPERQPPILHVHQDP